MKKWDEGGRAWDPKFGKRSVSAGSSEPICGGP